MKICLILAKICASVPKEVSLNQPHSHTVSMDTNCVLVITRVCLYLNTTGSLCACCVGGGFHHWLLSLTLDILVWFTSKCGANFQKIGKDNANHCIVCKEKKKKNKKIRVWCINKNSQVLLRHCWRRKSLNNMKMKGDWTRAGQTTNNMERWRLCLFPVCLGADLMFLLLIFFISLLQQKLQWKYKSHDSCIS